MQARYNRQFARRNPIFDIPEVSPGPLPDEVVAAMDRNPAVKAARMFEQNTVSRATGEQRLSRDLAALYRRDVFSDGGIPAGVYVELLPDGRCIGRRGVPPRGHMLNGPWKKMKVAADVAVVLLERDKSIDAPVRSDPPEEVPQFRMPTMAEMLR